MIKEYFKGLAKTYLKKITFTVIIILLVVVFLASSAYMIDNDKASKAETTTKKYKDKYVSVNPTQGIVSNLDYMNNPSGGGNSGDENSGGEDSEDEENKYGHELFKYLSDLGYDLEEHFDDPDMQVNINNVKKLLNAEIVTQFPYIEGLSADKVNGVIRFKRISSNDENQSDFSEDANANVSASLDGCLKYVEDYELLNWVWEYNDDNNNIDAKNKALNSFTLVSDEGYYRVQVAVLKEVKVVTNDEYKYVSEIGSDYSDVNDIRSELDLTFQDASYTVSTDPATGDTVYTFQVLELIEVDYLNMIEKYTMPSDFLFQLLTYTENLDFVLEVADLAYKSTIVVGIYEDNSSMVTYSKEYDYNRQVKLENLIETYVPKILGDYEEFSEEAEVSGNFEAFGTSVLSRYPDSGAVNTSEDYIDYFGVETSNIYDSSVYSDSIQHIYQYIIDDNGNPAITTEPKKYYLDYYFYENTPVCDLYVADIWYGYYSKNYTYNQLEMTEIVNEINPSEYVLRLFESYPDENLRSEIISIFEGTVESYVDSGVFDEEIMESFEYPEFEYPEFSYPEFSYPEFSYSEFSYPPFDYEDFDYGEFDYGEFEYEEFEYEEFTYEEFVPTEITDDMDDSEKAGIEAANALALEAYISAKADAETQYNTSRAEAKEQYEIDKAAAETQYDIDKADAEEQYEIDKAAAEDQYEIDKEEAEKEYDKAKEEAEKEYDKAKEEAKEEYDKEREEAYTVYSAEKDAAYIVYSAERDAAYEIYSTERAAAAAAHLEAGRNAKKAELKASLSSTTVNVTKTESSRDVKITEKILTSMFSTQEKYSYTEVAAENFHFSKILQNNLGAYNALEDVGDWLIEALQKNESTKNVVEKVTYLLNQAFGGNKFGEITSDDLKSLYTTTSANVDIPTNGSFLEIAKACHDYLRLNNYYYSSEANKNAGNYVQDGTSTGRYLPLVMGEPQNERYIDCSAYVTWVLMQTGHVSPTKKWQYTSYTLYANNADGLGFGTMAVSGVEDLTDEDLNTNGYILVKQGHTEIYAGKDDAGYYYTYNAGSTSSIRKEVSKYTKSQFYSHFNSDYKILIVGEA